VALAKDLNDEEDDVITDSLFYRTCQSLLALKLTDLWSASAVTNDMHRCGRSDRLWTVTCT